MSLVYKIKMINPTTSCFFFFLPTVFKIALIEGHGLFFFALGLCSSAAEVFFSSASFIACVKIRLI